VCFLTCGQFVCLLCIFGVLPLVCFGLSVPVQVIARKDSSVEWEIKYSLFTAVVIKHVISSLRQPDN